MKLTDEQVTEVVTTSYGMTIDEVTFLGTSDSSAYRVLSGEATYLFKLHSAHSPLSEVRSELQWLLALDEETILRVQRPVASLSGELATVHNGVVISLQHWVSGEHIETLTEGHLNKLAGLLLTLHRHAKQWQPPEDFTRPAYSTDQVSHLVQDLALSSLVTEQQQELFITASERIRNIVEKHPVSRDTWGLIHSDMHDGNYVMDGDQLHAIDFSCCGFGYYLFDVAEPLLHMMPEQRHRFVQEYAKQRGIPVDAELMEAFFLWQVFRNFAFLAKNPEEHDGLRQSIPRVGERFVAPFLAGERFLGI